MKIEGPALVNLMRYLLLLVDSKLVLWEGLLNSKSLPSKVSAIPLQSSHFQLFPCCDDWIAPFVLGFYSALTPSLSFSPLLLSLGSCRVWLSYDAHSLPSPPSPGLSPSTYKYDKSLIFWWGRFLPHMTSPRVNASPMLPCTKSHMHFSQLWFIYLFIYLFIFTLYTFPCI